MIHVEEKPASLEEKNVDLLGIIKYTTKLTGLDCTACASETNNAVSKTFSFLSRAIAILVIILMFYRAFAFLGTDGKPLTFYWSEGNTFGFIGLYTVVCSFCVMGWTSHAFIPNYLKDLNQVRLLRLEQDDQIDDYRGLRKKISIFPLPLLFALFFSQVYNAVHGKILYTGETVPAYKYSVFPILAFISWMASSTCIIYYILVQFSMYREIEYFNKELQKTIEGRKLKDLSTIADFSFRQTELLNLINKANESLQSYAKVGTVFCCFSLINAIYNMYFITTVPAPYAAVLAFLLISTVGITVLTLWPAARVQDQVAITAKLLMESHEIENFDNTNVYQIYRIMVDRSLKCETRIFVINAFGINTTNFNVTMFAIPNLGTLLIMLKKILEASGVNF